MEKRGNKAFPILKGSYRGCCSQWLFREGSLSYKSLILVVPVPEAGAWDLGPTLGFSHPDFLGG